MSKQISTENYNAQSIQVLKGLDPVRKRPGMYIGDVSSKEGLHSMFYEVLDNAMDEALAGYCNCINITLNKNGSISVLDNGRGIPIDLHEEEQIPAVELIMTRLHAGGKFGDSSYKVSGGLHGVGVSVVNALSDWLDVKIWRDDKEYYIRFENGEIVKKLIEIGPSNGKIGTEVTFIPSASVFAITEFDLDIITHRIKELAFLNSNIKLTLKDLRAENEYYQEYCFEGGVIEFAKYLDKAKKVLNDTILIKGEEEGVSVYLALHWNDSYYENTMCFTNNIRQRDGGTHLSGFRSAVTRSINNYYTNNTKKGKISIMPEDIREGMTAVLSLKVPDPKFSSQTKDKLVSGEVRPIVESIVSAQLTKWLEENPNAAKNIINRMTEAAVAREAARKARDLSRKKGKSEIATLPGKLASCQEKKPELCEILLVEGNSAGGSAKQARNRDMQAVLPLKGKILNVERARLDKVLNSAEIGTLISALETGIGEEDFNIDKLRYHKIIIMTDADVDGAHIRTLLMTFFYRYMPKIIENGHLYIAQPPLYRVRKGNSDVYLKDNGALKGHLVNLAVNEVNINHYNGEDLRKIIHNLFTFSDFIEQYGDDVTEVILMTLDLSALKEVSKSCDIITAMLNRLIGADNVFWECKMGEDSKLEVVKKEDDIVINYTVDTNLLISRLNNNLVKITSELSDLFKSEVNLKIKDVNYNYKLPFLLSKHIMEYTKKGSYIQRFKGLGEMNPEQLWSTTLDPETRTLSRVTIQAQDVAEQVFSTLMGEVPELRKEFIQRNALKVEYLDT